MALLKSGETPVENSAKTIQPVVVRTDNVAKELMYVATTNDVPVASLDFNLLETQTFTRIGAEGKEVDWEELASDELEQLNDKESLLNPEFQIRQMYEIEIFSKTEGDPLEGLDLSIGANGVKTRIFLTIKPGSHVTFYDNFEKDLIELANKKKLRANLMIDILDAPMHDALAGIVAKLRVNNDVTFKEKEMLQVAQGLDPVPTINDKMILHYEKKSENKDEAGRVDHSKRGFMLSVVQDELLMEYIKPKIGDPGRNCRGEFLKPREPVVSNEPNFTVTDKIEVKESEDKIEYVAKESGYIKFENNAYDIATEMEITEISFKTTGSIDTQMDADVSINVKESDSMKDAIGQGMEVEVNEINIDGNIGPNATVKAKKAVVEGQIHQSAMIEADELKINVHKGMAKGKNVSVTRLEHGTVIADNVKISQATGGKVMGKDIAVDIVGSHVTLTARNVIEIEKITGSENQFIITPVVMENGKEALSENEKKLLEAKKQFSDIEKEVSKLEVLLKQNERAYQDMKKRMLQYKKSGVKMPTAFVQKYKQFQEHQQQLEKYKAEYAQKEERLNLLSAKHNAFQSDILNARVINKGRWRGHNEIIFKLIEPEIEVSYVPPEGSEGNILALCQDEETGAYSIQVVDE